MKPVKADYFQTYVNQYVPQPFELYQRAVDNAQEQYDAVAANMEAIETSLIKQATHSGMPTEMFKAYQQQYTDRLQNILETTPDLRNAEDQVRKLGRQLGEDMRFGKMAQYVRAGQIEQEYFDWLKESKGKKLGEGGASFDRQRYAEDLHDRQMDLDIGERGEVLTKVMERNSPDIHKELSNYANLIKKGDIYDADGKLKGVYGTDAGKFHEYYQFVTQDLKGITFKESNAVLTAMAMANPDIYDEARIMAANNNASKYNLRPSEYEPTDAEIAREIASFVQPVATAVAHTDTKKTYKHLRPAELYGIKTKTVDPGTAFGYEDTYVKTLPKYDEFVKLRDGKSQQNTANAVKSFMDKYFISETGPRGNYTQDEALAFFNKYKSDPKGLLKSLKNGEGLAGDLSTAVRKEEYRKLQRHIREQENVEERHQTADGVARRAAGDSNAIVKEFNKLSPHFKVSSIEELRKELAKMGTDQAPFNLTKDIFESENEPDVVKLRNALASVQGNVDNWQNVYDETYEDYIDNNTVIELKGYVTNGADLKPRVDSEGKVLETGEEMLDNLLKGILDHKIIDKLTLRSDEGELLNLEGNATNLSRIKKDLGIEEGKDELVPPSKLGISVNPLEGIPVVTLAYENKTTGKVMHYKLPLSEVLSTASQSKSRGLEWAAKVSMEAAQGIGGEESQMYNSWGDPLKQVHYNGLNQTWQIWDSAENKFKASTYEEALIRTIGELAQDY
jgi:hypothetical protein